MTLPLAVEEDAGAREPVAAFDAGFRHLLAGLIAWRRDVRRFRADPVDEAVLHECLRLATLAPSVGNSQPWRFVRVLSSVRRQGVVTEFERCNEEARRRFSGARAETYARLKLEGLREAPVHLAVFCDEATRAGHGLGLATMRETLRYSVAGAVQVFWLAARAHGLGVGWVSILDPARIRTLLEVDPAWSFIGYLCVGHPVEEHLDPELVRHGWQQRHALDDVLVSR